MPLNPQSTKTQLTLAGEHVRDSCALLARVRSVREEFQDLLGKACKEVEDARQWIDAYNATLDRDRKQRSVERRSGRAVLHSPERRAKSS